VFLITDYKGAQERVHTTADADTAYRVLQSRQARIRTGGRTKNTAGVEATATQAEETGPSLIATAPYL